MSAETKRRGPTVAGTDDTGGIAGRHLAAIEHRFEREPAPLRPAQAGFQRPIRGMGRGRKPVLVRTSHPWDFEDCLNTTVRARVGRLGTAKLKLAQQRPARALGFRFKLPLRRADSSLRDRVQLLAHGA
jgi:hypothetical protein